MINLPFFYEPHLTQDAFVLSEESAKHCIQVLRKKEGEYLNITDGKGSLGIAVITSINKKSCEVKIVSVEKNKQPAAATSIAISILKNPNRFEWFLEKATEIGVQQIIPLICDRTEKKNFRFERMQQIIVSAMLQSQQCWLPQLHQPTSFNEVVLHNNYDVKLIAHCDKNEDKTNLQPKSSLTKTIILIGPEGDFSSAEILLAREKNFREVSLGNTRLRSETAGVVAATMLCIHS